MTLPKLTREIPSWFNIEKYDGLKKFKAIDWYGHLSLRDHLVAMIDPKWNHLQTEEYPEHRQAAFNALCRLRENPLSPDAANCEISDGTTFAHVLNFEAVRFDDDPTAAELPHIFDRSVSESIRSLLRRGNAQQPRWL
jgi:hypothetical protein